MDECVIYENPKRLNTSWEVFRFCGERYWKSPEISPELALFINVFSPLLVVV